MLISEKECFLFDLDGTLIDSSSLHDKAFRYALSTYQKDLLPTFNYEKYKGCSTLEAFRSMNIDNETIVTKLVSAKQTEYRRIAMNELQILPNADDLLRYLKLIGKRLFLITGGSSISVRQSLAAVGFQNVFEDVITSDDVFHAKPHPEPYQLCVTRHALSLSSCVVIEDAVNGIESARSAQLDVVGVNNPVLAMLAEPFFPNLFDLGRACGQDVAN